MDTDITAPDNVDTAADEAKAHEYCSLDLFTVGANVKSFNFLDLYSYETLNKMAQDPMANNDVLREISLVLYGTNGIYTNTVDYMTAMPTLSYVVATYGKNKAKAKKNKELMISALNAMKHKEIVRDALFKGMVEGVAFYYFETRERKLGNEKILSDYDVQSIVEINNAELNISVISLPADYTKIIGIRNSAYVLAFNLDYFVTSDAEDRERKLKKYPKEIQDAFRAHKRGWYILDYNKTIVHKIRSKKEEPWGRPLVLAAINDILYSDYYTQTKRGVLDEINNVIIYQTLPEGQQKGTSALTKQQQEKQHEKVKGAVFTKNNRGGYSFFSVAAGTKINILDTPNKDIFDDKYESGLEDKISLDMGLASSLLNGVGAGSFSTAIQNLELVTAQIMQWIGQIEEEINRCINANIIKDKNNRVECKYLPITHVNKDKMVGYAKDLYLQGRGSLGLWAAATGVSPEVFFALLDDELESKIEEKYPIHQTSFTLSKSDGQSGRPETDKPTDRTIQSRQNGGNEIPSPTD